MTHEELIQYGQQKKLDVLLGDTINGKNSEHYGFTEGIKDIPLVVPIGYFGDHSPEDAALLQAAIADGRVTLEPVAFLDNAGIPGVRFWRAIYAGQAPPGLGQGTLLALSNGEGLDIVMAPAMVEFLTEAVEKGKASAWPWLLSWRHTSARRCLKDFFIPWLIA